MVKQLAAMIAVVALASACGGGKKPATTPMEGSGNEMNETQVAGGGEQVTPEQIEEITKLLDRRQRIVSRCLADAVDSKELPRNARGKVTVELTVSTSGKVSSVKIIKNTLESERISECVMGHVRDIQFPELPSEFPTSYTYAFEAM
ncbi:MAG: AgmX/PglI C-terminal domain-containing protein [Kofleriaceae bacterium]|nr:AgmX/PglI C-terminal domain-containing protein [Kofleriaceae bacterium]